MTKTAKTKTAKTKTTKAEEVKQPGAAPRPQGAADKIPLCWYGGDVTLKEVEDLVYAKVLDRLQAKVTQEKERFHKEVQQFCDAFNVASTPLGIRAEIERDPWEGYRAVPYIYVTSPHGGARFYSGGVVNTGPLNAATSLLQRTKDNRAAFAVLFIEQRLKGAALVDRIVDDMVEQLLRHPIA